MEVHKPGIAVRAGGPADFTTITGEDVPVGSKVGIERDEEVSGGVE